MPIHASSSDPAAFAGKMLAVQRLLVVRLATLRRIMQRSARMAFERETGLPEFEWLIVSFVASHPNPVLSEVSDCLQRDRAQVSRAARALVERGLLSRERLRAPLALTDDGVRMNERIERLLAQRNQALLSGLPVTDLALLDGVLDTLFQGANRLLEEERRFSGAVQDDAEPVPRVKHAVAGGGVNGHLIMPDLHVLLRLLRRSAELAYARATGLSGFDWRTLTHVEMASPATLTELAASLDRNKSQVSRAVASLESLGLAARVGKRGVHGKPIHATPAGSQAYALVSAEAARRDDVLVGDLTVRQHRLLNATLDAMTRNALDLLEAERNTAPSSLSS